MWDIQRVVLRSSTAGLIANMICYQVWPLTSSGDSVKSAAMSNDKYIEYAARCIEAAQRATKREEKIKFLEMAQTWRELAEKFETADKLVEEAKELGLVPSRDKMN